MKKTNMAKKLALYSAVAVICAAGQSAFAHTGIKDKLFVEGIGNTGSGAAAYNAFTTTHGCATNDIPEGGSGQRLNVIAQAALFPNSPSSVDTIVYRYKTGSIVANTVGVDGTVLTGQATSLPVTSPNDLSDDINGALAGAGFNNLGMGLVSPNLFGNLIIPKTDANLVARGYAAFSGPVPTVGGVINEMPLQESVISTTGLSPFKFNVPTFKTTSCAKNLIVRVAVTNWCKRGGGVKHDADRKDVWIGTDTHSVLYSMTGPDHGIMPNSRVTLGMTDTTSEQGNGKSFWPSFTVTRDLVKNPLPAACNGDSYDVVIEPSGADIDANLTIKQGAFPTGAPGNKFE